MKETVRMGWRERERGVRSQCVGLYLFGCNDLLLDGWPLQISAPEKKVHYFHNKR